MPPDRDSLPRLSETSAPHVGLPGAEMRGQGGSYQPDPEPRARQGERPYWNGEPCQARRVRVIVADAPEHRLYWARPLVGTERVAVEVIYGGQTFYIDDEGYAEREEVKTYLREHGMVAADHIGHPGWGWEKVMAGGGPGQGHASLEIERVVGECERSLNEIAQDIIDMAPETEPLVEEWFAVTTAARAREWKAWEAAHAS